MLEQKHLQWKEFPWPKRGLRKVLARLELEQGGAFDLKEPPAEQIVRDKLKRDLWNFIYGDLISDVRELVMEERRARMASWTEWTREREEALQEKEKALIKKLETPFPKGD